MERAALQHAQQLALQHVHVADLVEKDGTRARLLEGAHPCLVGAGEGAPLVPKEQALHQPHRQRHAVHGDHGAALRPRAPVQVARGDLLAHAGLPRQQHRGVRRAGDLVQLPDHLLHAARAAQQPLTLVILPAAPRTAQLIPTLQLLNPLHQRLQAGLLDHVVLGAATDRRHRVGDRVVRGHHHQRGPGLPGQQLRDQVDPVLVGEPVVEQDHREGAALGPGERLLPGEGQLHLHPHPTQLAADGLGVQLLVVHH